jgi:hypothetical protein
MMLTGKGISENPQSGQVTMMHLLLAIAFVMPITGAMAKHFGSGALCYLIVLPASLAVGALIVWSQWKLGKALWSRCQRYSKKAPSAVALFLFALELLWIVVGVAAGSMLAALAVRIFRG